MKGSKWETEFCKMLKDLGYMYVHAKSAYEAQTCDVVITGRSGEAFLPIYVECKSTKHDRIALSRNKRLREQYLAFRDMCGGRGFYAVQYGDGGVRFYVPPFGSLTLRESDLSGILGVEGVIEHLRPHNNPPICPPVSEMREPEDREL